MDNRTVSKPKYHEFRSVRIEDPIIIHINQ